MLHSPSSYQRRRPTLFGRPKLPILGASADPNEKSEITHSVELWYPQRVQDQKPQGLVIAGFPADMGAKEATTTLSVALYTHPTEL